MGLEDQYTTFTPKITENFVSAKLVLMSDSLMNLVRFRFATSTSTTMMVKFKTTKVLEIDPIQGKFVAVEISPENFKFLDNSTVSTWHNLKDLLEKDVASILDPMGVPMPCNDPETAKLKETLADQENSIALRAQ